MSGTQPLILADAITTVTAGPSVGLRGERIWIGNTSNYQRIGKPLELKIKASGAATSTATIQIQESPDGITWTTYNTYSFTIPANGTAQYWNPVSRLHSTHDYIRLNVTAISGCTINATVARMG